MRHAAELLAINVKKRIITIKIKARRSHRNAVMMTKIGGIVVNLCELMNLSDGRSSHSSLLLTSGNTARLKEKLTRLFGNTRKCAM